MCQDGKRQSSNAQAEYVLSILQKGMVPYTKRDEDYWIMKAIERIEQEKARKDLFNDNDDTKCFPIGDHAASVLE